MKGKTIDLGNNKKDCIVHVLIERKKGFYMNLYLIHLLGCTFTQLIFNVPIFIDVFLLSFVVLTCVLFYTNTSNAVFWVCSVLSLILYRYIYVQCI